MTFTTQSIADLVGGKLVGPGDLVITGLEQLALAAEGQLSFIGDERHAERWVDTAATAALITRGLEAAPRDGKALIFVDNADLAMAAVLDAFAPPPVLPPEGVHPTAIIDPTARVAPGCRIGPLCVVGPRVTLGEGCVLHAQVTLLDDARVGRECHFWPGVVVRDRCILGDRCILHPNAVVGADGFGYRPGMTPQGPGIVKIPHIGIVRLGNDVELGAGCCVDRGKFSATFIDDGSKLDNMVQVGHNCRIGKCVVISGCCAIAGSVIVGDGVMMGGNSALKDHIRIGRGARVAGGSNVMHDIPAGETWAGTPAIPLKQAARRELVIQRLLKESKSRR